mmetsp:Transcript_38971/g.45386  ORF Transcript_38971/g.45386 Transcript_38971/m.45386 type:complete len:81 (-) Transcript_38971:69-311(-)
MYSLSTPFYNTSFLPCPYTHTLMTTHPSIVIAAKHSSPASPETTIYKRTACEYPPPFPHSDNTDTISDTATTRNSNKHSH